jgi:hypothetical protein
VAGHPDINIEVTWWSAVLAGLTLTAQPYAVTIINARRDFNGECLVTLDAAPPVAIATRLLDLFAGTPAAWTSLLDREETLLPAHLAMAAAGGTGHRGGAGLGTATVAGLAGLQRRQIDVYRIAEYGLLQIHDKLIAQVGPAIHLTLTTTTATENVAKHIAEHVAKGITWI